MVELQVDRSVATSMPQSDTEKTIDKPTATITTAYAHASDSEDIRSSHSIRSSGGRSAHVPIRMKVFAVLLVSLIGFGSHWSSGVTGGMKSTLKKELKINNTQYALLDGSEDFMKTALILFTGVLTDRIGGARAMVWGNVVYTLGSIIVAAATTVRNYKLMIGGIVIQSFGDIATQVAQYRIFSSWFAPSNGFASTLGFELAIGKIGSFVGQATANPIAKGTGDFSWVYWTAVFLNLFTNMCTVGFWFFRKYCDRTFSEMSDPATGEKLRENTKKVNFWRLWQLPYTYWLFILFSLFQTSASVVYSQNATELAEQRFHVSSVKAGWYTATARYLGFFLVPCIGIFIDLLGHRLSLLTVCGVGEFIAMILVAFGPSVSGTAASLGIYAFASTSGPTVIIDGIRTAIWSQDSFGAGYGVKIGVNNAMNIIVRIITGVIQDRDNNSYDRVVIVYVVLSAGAVVVSLFMLWISFVNSEMRSLQWTKKQRMQRGPVIDNQREKHENGEKAARNRWMSRSAFVGVVALILGSWVAYFWGIAKGYDN